MACNRDFTVVLAKLTAGLIRPADQDLCCLIYERKLWTLEQEKSGCSLSVCDHKGKPYNYHTFRSVIECITYRKLNDDYIW